MQFNVLCPYFPKSELPLYLRFINVETTTLTQRKMFLCVFGGPFNLNDDLVDVFLLIHPWRRISMCFDDKLMVVIKIGKEVDS